MLIHLLGNSLSLGLNILSCPVQSWKSLLFFQLSSGYRLNPYTARVTGRCHCDHHRLCTFHVVCASYMFVSMPARELAVIKSCATSTPHHRLWAPTPGTAAPSLANDYSVPKLPHAMLNSQYIHAMLNYQYSVAGSPGRIPRRLIAGFQPPAAGSPAPVSDPYCSPGSSDSVPTCPASWWTQNG